MQSQQSASGILHTRLSLSLAVLLGLAFPVILIAIFGSSHGSQRRLIREMGDPKASVRAHAAFELSEDEYPTTAAILALTRELADSVDEARSEAVATLISIGRRDSAKADAVVRAMISLISASSAVSSSRVQAIHILSQLGPRSQIAGSSLLATLRARDDSLRAAAADAFGQIGVNEATLQALDGAVDDPVPEVRAAALESLSRLRPGDGTSRVAARLIGDASVEVRLAAVYALAGAESYGAQIDRAIDAAVRDSIPEIRRAAVMTLGRLAPNAASTREKLQSLSTDSAVSVRQAALEVLRNSASVR